MDNSQLKTVITIDGPAGAGKSTVARKLAKRLGLIHLNSGALFRAAGIAAHRRGIQLEDEIAVANVAEGLMFEFVVSEKGDTQLLVDGKNQDEELRSPLASELSSKVGVHPAVREILLRVQRDLGAKHSLVVEGRDSGSVVFRDAQAKFFLEASPEVRASRRAKETGEDPEHVLRQSVERDERDRSRAAAPLVKSEDAILLDTSNLSIEEVIDSIWAELEKKKLV